MATCLPIGIDPNLPCNGCPDPAFISEIMALTVRQPFAALIASGIKTLETRGWQTDYRGPLLICAGKEAHSLYKSYNLNTGTLELGNQSAPAFYQVDFDLFKIEGAAVCTVDLVGVRPFLKGSLVEKDACCDWFPGGFVWELENPRLVEPKPIRGRPGLFKANLIKYRGL